MSISEDVSIKLPTVDDDFKDIADYNLRQFYFEEIFKGMILYCGKNKNNETQNILEYNLTDEYVFVLFFFTEIDI